jgi:hypothetical protein
VAALPLIGRAAAAAGKVEAVDAATNATISSVGYYLNHRAEKDEIDWAEFRRTVGQQTLDQTLSDFKNPLNFLPTRKLERAGEVFKLADEVDKIPGRPFVGTNAPQRAYGHLQRYHGVDPKDASDRLHKIKGRTGLSPDDDVVI